MAKNSAHNRRKALREQHFHLQGGLCIYCKRQMTQDALSNKDASVSLEHVLPRTHGGKDTLDNTVAACHTCNSHRRDRRLSMRNMIRVMASKPVRVWPSVVTAQWHATIGSFKHLAAF